MYYKSMEYYNHRTHDLYEIVGGEYERKKISHENHTLFHEP